MLVPNPSNMLRPARVRMELSVEIMKSRWLEVASVLATTKRVAPALFDSMEKAAEELQRHQEKYESEFNEFFPDLMENVRTVV